MFDIVLIQPILNILVIIYQSLLSFNIPYTLGFSIIGLTVVIRFVLYPFTAAQLKTSKKMQDITPHISGLKEKHKNDTKKLHEETMRIYKEHGVNPAAGCLPMLIQLPIIWGLYAVLDKVVRLGAKENLEYVNKMVYSPSLKLSSPLDQIFFGIALSQSPSELLPKLGVFVFLIPLITGVLQYIQSKMMVPPAAATKEKKQDDFASAFQTQSLYIFPVMIAFFSYSLPLGLSLYWNTFTLFGILQQQRIQGGLEHVVSQVWKKK
jgi:YidC/Oxa1 family membrane protein insertase